MTTGGWRERDGPDGPAALMEALGSGYRNGKISLDELRQLETLWYDTIEKGSQLTSKPVERPAHLRDYSASRRNPRTKQEDVPAWVYNTKTSYYRAGDKYYKTYESAKRGAKIQARKQFNASGPTNVFIEGFKNTLSSPTGFTSRNMGHVSINSDGRITLHLANGRNGTSRNPSANSQSAQWKLVKSGSTRLYRGSNDDPRADAYYFGGEYGGTKADAQRTADTINRQQGRTGSERIVVKSASASRRSNPANIAKASANIARYVVYVGDKAAWVGKLKSKANAAATDLMDRGRAGVKIYQAKVTNAVRDGWRQAFVN